MQFNCQTPNSLGFSTVKHAIPYRGLSSVVYAENLQLIADFDKSLAQVSASMGYLLRSSKTAN